MKLFRRKPKRIQEKPFFRFYPGAYDDGGPLISSQEKCGCCGEPCVWQYTGSIYSPDEITVCAGCIAANNLEAIVRKGCSLHDIELEEDLSSDLASELNGCTPGVACFNPFEWPVDRGLPMAFIGYGDKLETDKKAVEATERAYAALGWDDQKGSSSYALIFRSLEGDVTRAVIDLD